MAKLTFGEILDHLKKCDAEGVATCPWCGEDEEFLGMMEDSEYPLLVRQEWFCHTCGNALKVDLSPTEVAAIRETNGQWQYQD